MIEIIPAVLPKDFDDLSVHLLQVKGKAPWVQIDVCDGMLVLSKTWPYTDSSHWSDISTEKEGLPLWEDFQFEVDLMVNNPVSVIDDWIRAGVSRIIMQVGGKNSIEEVRAAVAGRTEFVVAVSFEDDLSQVEPYIQEGDAIQVMGISRVGFQGEHFDDRAIDLVRHFKEKFPDVILSVDGGVNLESVSRLVEAGATRLVVGSALFNTEDIRETLSLFKERINDVHIGGENN